MCTAFGLARINCCKATRKTQADQDACPSLMSNIPSKGGKKATGKGSWSLPTYPNPELHLHLKCKVYVKRKEFGLKPFQVKAFLFIFLLSYS